MRFRLSALVFAGVSFLAFPLSAKEKPNVVLIISDDQSWTDYGFMGHELLETPHLDELAARSAVFRRGYVPTALCRPSLATLATGRYAHEHGITGNDPSPALTGGDQDDPDYSRLRAELIAVTAAPDAPGLIGAGATLQRGDRGARVDALRARLHELGLLSDPGRPGDAFDAALESALMRFQARRNLAADGRAGAVTVRELDAGADRRVDQLRANLERWRWLPADLGERHIRVNIADYRLEAWSNGRVERVHETQIGKTYASTPVFSEAMSIVEINPWWLTPGGLGSRWVSTFRRNPGYAYSQGYHLVDLDTGERVNAYTVDWTGRRFRVIQEPGPTNAMGEVKFLFPNRHNVYIHDTPHRDVFALSRRDDSAGCVRVRDPRALAVWVLGGEGWSAADVREAFEAERTVRVRLQNEIPVHILYFTAVTDRLGRVRFVHDVYGRDQRLIDALDGRMPPPPPAAPAREETGAGAL